MRKADEVLTIARQILACQEELAALNRQFEELWDSRHEATEPQSAGNEEEAKEKK